MVTILWAASISIAINVSHDTKQPASQTALTIKLILQNLLFQKSIPIIFTRFGKPYLPYTKFTLGSHVCQCLFSKKCWWRKSNPHVLTDNRFSYHYSFRYQIRQSSYLPICSILSGFTFLNLFVVWTMPLPFLEKEESNLRSTFIQ